MIGVVLWKGSDDGCAIIWCEDQGDLAYVDNRDDTPMPDACFDVGDVVQFDVFRRDNMRAVRNLNRLQGPIWPEGPGENKKKNLSADALIVPFRAPENKEQTSDDETKELCPQL